MTPGSAGELLDAASSGAAQGAAMHAPDPHQQEAPQRQDVGQQPGSSSYVGSNLDVLVANVKTSCLLPSECMDRKLRMERVSYMHHHASVKACMQSSSPVAVAVNIWWIRRVVCVFIFSVAWILSVRSGLLILEMGMPEKQYYRFTNLDSRSGAQPPLMHGVRDFGILMKEAGGSTGVCLGAWSKGDILSLEGGGGPSLIIKRQLSGCDSHSVDWSIKECDQPTRHWREALTGWYFTTSDSSVEDDPVRFIVEASDDLIQWQTVGSSAQIATGNEWNFLTSKFDTPRERGRLVAFSLQGSWGTFGDFCTWSVYAVIYTALFLVAEANLSRYASMAIVAGYFTMAFFSIVTGIQRGSEQSYGECAYFAVLGFFFGLISLGFRFYEHMFDVMTMIPSFFVVLIQILLYTVILRNPAGLAGYPNLKIFLPDLGVWIVGIIFVAVRIRMVTRAKKLMQQDTEIYEGLWKGVIQRELDSVRRLDRFVRQLQKQTDKYEARQFNRMLWKADTSTPVGSSRDLSVLERRQSSPLKGDEVCQKEQQAFSTQPKRIYSLAAQAKGPTLLRSGSDQDIHPDACNEFLQDLMFRQDESDLAFGKSTTSPARPGAASLPEPDSEIERVPSGFQRLPSFDRIHSLFKAPTNRTLIPVTRLQAFEFPTEEAFFANCDARATIDRNTPCRSLDQLHAQACVLESVLVKKVLGLAQEHPCCFKLKACQPPPPEDVGGGLVGRQDFLLARVFSWRGGGQVEREVNPEYARFERGTRVEDLDLWGVKSVLRCVQKVDTVYKADPSYLLDLCRQRVAFDTVQELHSYLHGLQADPDVRIVRVKSSMSQRKSRAAASSLRFVSVNLRITTQLTAYLGVDTHVCEVLLLLRPFAEAQAPAMHARYCDWRDAQSTLLGAALEAWGHGLRALLSWLRGGTSRVTPLDEGGERWSRDHSTNRTSGQPSPFQSFQGERVEESASVPSVAGGGGGAIGRPRRSLPDLMVVKAGEEGAAAGLSEQPLRTTSSKLNTIAGGRRGSSEKALRQQDEGPSRLMSGGRRALSNVWPNLSMESNGSSPSKNKQRFSISFGVPRPTNIPDTPIGGLLPPRPRLQKPDRVTSFGLRISDEMAATLEALNRLACLGYGALLDTNFRHRFALGLEDASTKSVLFTSRPLTAGSVKTTIQLFFLAIAAGNIYYMSMRWGQALPSGRPSFSHFRYTNIGRSEPPASRGILVFGPLEPDGCSIRHTTVDVLPQPERWGSGTSLYLSYPRPVPIRGWFVEVDGSVAGFDYFEIEGTDDNVTDISARWHLVGRPIKPLLYGHEHLVTASSIRRALLPSGWTPAKVPVWDLPDHPRTFVFDEDADFAWILFNVACPAFYALGFLGFAVLGACRVPIWARRCLLLSQALHCFTCLVLVVFLFLLGRVLHAFEALLSIFTELLLLKAIWREKTYFRTLVLAVPTEILHKVGVHIMYGSPLTVAVCSPLLIILSFFLVISVLANRIALHESRKLVAADQRRYDELWQAEVEKDKDVRGLEHLEKVVRMLGILPTDKCRQHNRMVSGSLTGFHRMSAATRIQPRNPLLDSIGSGYLPVPGTIDPRSFVDSVDQLYSQASISTILLKQKIKVWAEVSNGFLPLSTKVDDKFFMSWREAHKDPQVEALIRWPTMKRHRRAIEKLLRSYDNDVSCLVDVARHLLLFRTVADLTLCLGQVATDEHVKIVRVKNRMSKSYNANESLGYRDVAVNFRIESPESLALGTENHVMELQLQLLSFGQLRTQEGHKNYVDFRNLKSI